MEVAAAEELVEDFVHDGPQRAIAGEILPEIFLTEGGDVIVNALPEDWTALSSQASLRPPNDHECAMRICANRQAS